VPNIASVVVTTAVAQVVVMAHNKSPLHDAEWESEYLAHVRRVKSIAGQESAANLVFAEGQGPTSKQRAVGNAIFGRNEGYQFKVAVVTTSALVRGAVTALGWFNPLIDAFPPDRYRDAFAHVRLSERDHPAMRKALAELRERIGDVGVLNDVARALEGGTR
jgi:hypothetical protein